MQIIRQLPQYLRRLQTFNIKLRQRFLTQADAQDGAHNGTYRRTASGMIHSNHYSPVKILMTHQAGINSTCQHLGRIFALQPLHHIHTAQAGRLRKGNGMPQHGGKVISLAVLMSKVFPNCRRGGQNDLLQISLGVPQKQTHDMGQHRS